MQKYSIMGLINIISDTSSVLWDELMPLRKLILNYLKFFRSPIPHSIGLCLLSLLGFFLFLLSTFPSFFLFTFLLSLSLLLTYIPANPVSDQAKITNLSKKNVILFQSQEQLDFKRSETMSILVAILVKWLLR